MTLRLDRVLMLMVVAACGGDKGVSDPVPNPPAGVTPPTPANLVVSGRGAVTARYSAEVWIHGNYGYTSTWGNRAVGGVATPGNTVYIWDVRGPVPVLLDSVAVPGATTVGDVQVSSDGRFLVVPIEPGPGSIVTYDLADPVRPRMLSVFTSPKITRGVHTCEIQTIGGRLYAFLAVNRGSSHPSRLMIVDLGDPLSPSEVVTLDIADSFVHDVYVRDGILFTAQWGNGMVIYDIGGGARGGTPQAPVVLGAVRTIGGSAHNIWWVHDPSDGSRRYAFVGQEGPATLFSSSSGDIHVVDVSTLGTPTEVAFLSVPGAGTHNFSVDEAGGLLYAAYYNGGVQVLDVRGDLSSCTAAQRASDGRCDLRAMGRLRAVGLLDQGMPTFVWGVHFTGGAVYASDMLNGLWRLAPVSR